MLRHLSLPFALMLLWVSASTHADERSELTALLAEFLAGASVNDAAMHQRFWSEDLVYTSSSGARYGKQTILDGMDESPAPDEEPAVYTSDQLKVRVLGDGIAVVTFRLVATSPAGDVDYYLNTGVFERDEDVWRASTWQATRVPK